MTVKIDLPKQVEERLSAKAKQAGLDVASYVAQVVQAHASSLTLKELSGSVYHQFVASGMSDDQLGDWLEQAKDQMRADRRQRGANAR